MNFDCIPCFQRQALQAVRFIHGNEYLQERVLREVMKKLLELTWDFKPIEMAYEVHKVVRKSTQVTDPYGEVKKASNDLVLDRYSKLTSMVDESEDPLRTAVTLAIAGNIIDFGALREFDLDKTISDVSKKTFAIDDYRKFKEKLKDADTLLFFADNAGEICFDKLLIESMLKIKSFKRLNFVVKGGPIINDATLEDALYVGLDKLPNINFLTISNGEVNTGPKIRSQDVAGWVKTCDLVISKGQANYEGLSEFNEIFFALIVKCFVVASDLRVNLKDLVFKYNLSRK
jgi:uncharacterized protein with ATP-grasp and redox domains